MRNLSTEFKEQQNSGNRNYLKYADFTFTNGSTLSITNEDLWSNGFKFEDAVSQSGSFDIGAAIVNKLTLQINNFSGKFSDYIWDGARVVCYIGMELSTGIEKIRICTMTVTDAPYQSTTIINLTCEDYMRKFDHEYSESNLAYPATRLQIVQDACDMCGVTLQTTRFDNDNLVIQSRPNDSSLTYRQVIAWAAQMGCQWAKCDEYGRLCLGWYETENPEKFYGYADVPWQDTNGNDILDTNGEQIITTIQKGIDASCTSGFTPWLYDVEITGIKVTEYVENSSKNEAGTYQLGKDGYIIEISGNKLIQLGTGNKICQIIYSRCVGMKFRPFSTNALTDIAWESGDAILIVDRSGKKYKSYLTSVTLNPGAFESLACSAKSISRNSQKQYSLEQRINSDNQKSFRDERTAREKAIKALEERITESSGVFTTIVKQEDGSNIYYLHNKPKLEESDMIWKMTAEAWAVSTDGGNTWNGGMTVDGDVIARILTATGVNADWVNAGTLAVKDKDGNIMFLANIDTGQVIINAESLKIQGKDVEKIAQEKAVQEISKASTNNLVKGYNLSQDDILNYWDTAGNISYSQNDPAGGNDALHITNITAGTQFIAANAETNPIITTRINGTYYISVWMRSDSVSSILANSVGVIFNGVEIGQVSVSTIWKKYTFNVQINAINTNEKFAIKAYRLNGNEIYMYRPEITFGYNSSDVFNMLTNNGITQGIYLLNNKIYLNGEFIKALSVTANAIAADAVTADKIKAKSITADKTSISELAALSATIAGFLISNEKISKFSNDYVAEKLGTGIEITSSENAVKLYGARGTIILSGTSIHSNQGTDRLLIYANSITNSDGFTDGQRINRLGSTLFTGNAAVSGDFHVYGTKSVIAKTENYGEQAFYCYETPTPVLGDFGGSTIGDDGISIISIDDIFRESTETEIEYYVFLQNEGEGQSWVSEKTDTYFVVRGTPGLHFAWELKAKQKEKEFIRFNAGKENKEIDFTIADLESAMFEERERIIKDMEGELL